jgi:hypothetical protein
MVRVTKTGGGVAPAQAARLAAIGVVAVAAAAFGASRPAPGPDRSIDREPLTLLYVGAEDCASCRAWRRDHRDAFLATLDPSRVTYREVIAARTATAFDETTWPEDLRGRLADAQKVGGVPLWIVIKDERRRADAVAGACAAGNGRGRERELISIVGRSTRSGVAKEESDARNRDLARRPPSHCSGLNYIESITSH